MKREQRRLRLARRQNLIAQVGQRSAMRALADALSEEARSDALAKRSLDLARHYGEASEVRDGADLTHKGQFAAALGTLKAQAEQARADAAQQAQWQADALGQASTRADRQRERVEAAYAELQAAKAQREREMDVKSRTKGNAGLRKERGHDARLARKVQGEAKPRSTLPNDEG